MAFRPGWGEGNPRPIPGENTRSIVSTGFTRGYIPALLRSENQGSPVCACGLIALDCGQPLYYDIAMKTVASKREQAMVKQSLWAHSRHEIERHKWIECEKAGRDLGEAPIFDWISMHWNGFLRARWLEHLQGKTFWTELDRGDFGVLTFRFRRFCLAKP